MHSRQLKDKCAGKQPVTSQPQRTVACARRDQHPSDMDVPMQGNTHSPACNRPGQQTSAPRSLTGEALDSPPAATPDAPDAPPTAPDDTCGSSGTPRSARFGSTWRSHGAHVHPPSCMRPDVSPVASAQQRHCATCPYDATRSDVQEMHTTLSYKTHSCKTDSIPIRGKVQVSKTYRR